MKKLKFICLSLITLFLLFFNFIIVPIDVHADVHDGFWGAPASAKMFRDIDGKGIRLYIMEVYTDDNGIFDYAYMCAIKDYQFEDGELEKGTDYTYDAVYFDDDLKESWISYYLDTYQAGYTIPEWDRTYVYFNVETQSFWFEYHGRDYYEYWYQQYFTLFDEMEYDRFYDEGYDVGYDAGYDVGYEAGYDYGYDYGYEDGYDEGILVNNPEAYQEGFRDGEKSKLATNNEAFYKGIEKWLVPAIITVIVLGGFVTIVARKRKEE